MVPSRQDSGGLPASITKPHQLRRQPSQQEEPAASQEEVTPLQFSPSACQGGDVTWATSAISPATAPTAEATRRPGSPAGTAEPVAPPRETRAVTGNAILAREGVTLRMCWKRASQRQGLLLCCLPQPPRLRLTQARMLPPPVMKAAGRSWSRQDKRASEESDWLLGFLSSEIPKLSCQHEAPGPRWLLPLHLIKMTYNEISGASVPLATFQLLDSHRWLGAAAPDGADREHFHHRRKFCWAMLSSVILPPEDQQCAHCFFLPLRQCC